MHRRAVSRWLLAGLLIAGGPAAAHAQAPPVAATGGDQEAAQAIRTEIERLRQEFQQLQQRYEQRFTALETRLAALEGEKKAGVAGAQAAAPPPVPPAAPPGAVEVPAGAAGAGGPTGSLPVYSNTAALSKIFNPDIAVIGDFLGAAGRNDVMPSPGLEMHEAETSFQAVVDPYARADFFLTFGPEGAGIEEGYLSLTSLPGGLLTRVGRMRGAFGKVALMHNHVLPWTDRPIVIDNLVGGEDAVADSGISVSRLLPNRWVFLEATGQVFGGSNEVFAAPTRGDLTYIGHLRAYQDLTESTNVDLGTSVAYGHNDAGPRFTTRLVGFDVTARYRPLRRAIYRQLIARSELVWSRRGEESGNQRAFGFYVSGDYQFARRWFGGVRYDRSGRASAPGLTDRGASLLLTYWPSEFSQVRGQYRHTRYGEGQRANEFLFQFLFSIGAHGAHPF